MRTPILRVTTTSDDIGVIDLLTDCVIYELFINS